MDAPVKYSNFHVTVNYNIDSEDHIGEMRTAIEEMVDSPYLWWWLKQFDGTHQLQFEGAQRNLVDRVRLRAAFEHGGRQNHGLHVHILVEVAHSTMVQLSKDGIIAVFEHFVPGRRPNVHCRFVPGKGEDKDFILHYITKEVSGSHTLQSTHPASQVPRRPPQNRSNLPLQRAFAGDRRPVDAENELPY